MGAAAWPRKPVQIALSFKIWTRTFRLLSCLAYRDEASVVPCRSPSDFRREIDDAVAEDPHIVVVAEAAVAWVARAGASFCRALPVPARIFAAKRRRRSQIRT